MVTLCNTRLNVMPAECIYVFYMGLRRNNYYIRVQREEKRFWGGGEDHCEVLVLKATVQCPHVLMTKLRCPYTYESG
jgi:hypothetical protein